MNEQSLSAGADPIKVVKVVRGLRKFGRGFGFFWVVVAFLLNLSAVIAIVYLAWNESWLPALFFLLARKELVSWMDTRLDELKKDIAEVNQPA